MKINILKIQNLILVFLLTSCFIGSGINSEIHSTSNNKFPIISGIDLDGNNQNLPDSFKGKFNLIAIGFEREHQEAINSWIKIADKIISENPNFKFYEVPLIYKLGSFSRLWINNGMRMGIQDKIARTRTITVYTDREKFFQIMKMKGDKVYLLLLDDKGNILWRCEGSATEKNINDLMKFMKKI